ncbi:MAG: tyrosine-type recombinase/integrase [Sporolactobacillus sp.]
MSVNQDKKTKLWYYRLSYKKLGKYSTKNESGFKTKKAAALAESQMSILLNKGNDINASERLFSTHMREWYEIYRKGKNSPDNDRDIDRSVRFAEEHFAGVKMKDLTRAMYQRALNEYAENHSTASVKKRHTYMRACVRDAIEDGIIFKDPTYRAQIKGKVPPKNESLKYLSEFEVKRLTRELLSNLRPRFISRYMILFGLATGARFAEILGMTWDCVDLKNRTVTINKTWDYQDTNNFGNTKNYWSKRTITIDEQTCDILEQLKNKQTSNIKNLVFINTKAELVSNNAVNKCLKSLCRKLNMQEMTCHSLRHTHASLLIYRGVNIKYVSKRLGHKNIVTTLQTYSHILDEMEQKESRQVDEMMNQIYKSNAK